MKIELDIEELVSLASNSVSEEYSDTLKDLKEEQQELFIRIVKGIQREYLALTLGPKEDRPKHEENLKSLRNALHAVEGIAAIKAYRATVNIVGRVLAGIAKAAVKAAIGL